MTRVGNDKRQRSTLVVVVHVAWIVVLVISIGGYLVGNFEQLTSLPINFSWGWFGAILVIEGIKRAFGAARWTYIAEAAQFSTSWSKAADHVRIFFISNLFGYIPSGGGTVVSRVELYRRRGIRWVETLGLHGAESYLLAISSLPLFVLALPFFTPLSAGQSYYLALLATGITLFGLHPFFLKQFLRIIGRQMNVSLNGKTSLTLFVFGLIAKVLGGLSFVCAALSLGAEFGLDMVPSLIGLFSTAWLVGAISIWAPAGIGVRESILVLGLGASMSLDQAILTSALARAGTLIPDLILGVGSLIARPRGEGIEHGPGRSD